MPTREVIVREALLTDNLTIEPPMDRETRKVITAIHDGKDTRLEFGAGELSITATSTETTMSADAWHTLIAAARTVLLALEKAGKPIPEANLTAAMAQRGFTAEHVREAVNLLRTEKLVARRDGVIHDLTGAGGRAKRRLSEVSLSPRTTTAPSTPSPSTPANTRPRMPVGTLIENPDQHMAMAARLRAQAAQMPNPSFEVGDVPAPAPSVKKDEKTPVSVPEGAVVAAIAELVDVFPRKGKVTLPLNDWLDEAMKRRVPMPDLPEGWTPADVWRTATQRALNGTLRKNGDDITHVPAEKAVAALTKWLSDAALPGKTITVAALAADVQHLTPSGWAPESIAQLVLDAVTESGVIERVDGGYMKPAPKVVEPEAPAPAPVEQKPSGDTTSSTPAPKPSGKAPKTDTETPSPPAVNSPVLEKKVDKLTDSVERVERKLDTLPAPPSAEKVLMAGADTAVKALLESVCVRLKVDGAMTEGAIHRALPGKSKPSRVNPNPVDRRLRLGEALTLGVDARILAFDHITRKYRLITVINLMPKTELDRRVQRIKDMRDAA